MGVPKFYRWISERYPCLSEVVKEFQLPDFDNLYLDMNGIIHVCSHPDDDNPHFRITEEKIFTDICYYIDFLFRMIKPGKVFFMAVDGVAPRAKMNQQRGRRFRSAREAEELIEKAKQAGETLPTEKRFDSNCITPGTPFMVRLQDHLKYFVVDKISRDPLWQDVKVYLSGHETPGEGEHKVMDYIRWSKSQPGYDGNTRHCLYGLDADLMMLGLTSHEPHFSLLREEVRFGGKRDRNKRPATPEETTFHLLHLSLMRDYLAYEFSPLKGKLSFPWDLERLIDDWILMGFLVGNDFIPHLPHFHIHHDALPLLWNAYMKVLPTMDGYINDGGHLNLPRLEIYFEELKKIDYSEFQNAFSDLKYLEGKIGGKSINESAGNAADKLKFVKKPRPAKVDGNGAISLDNGDELPDDFGFGFSMDDEEQVESTLEDEFTLHKRDYYMNKLGYTAVTSDVKQELAEGYVRAIQWILLYYFEGVPSWSWYYPHHYSPYISDIRGFKHMRIDFDLSTPFLPFQQLMAVLPSASIELLPPAFQPLMIEQSSPVIDFYPVNFESDLNGKQQTWEAVVVIPFIKEERLLAAMKTKEHLLTREECARNSHGPHLMYTYTFTNMGFFPSTLPGTCPDINTSHAQLTLIDLDSFRIDGKKLKKGLGETVDLSIYYPGFPTLWHLPHEHELKSVGVKVFQHNSRSKSLVLHINNKRDIRLEELADNILGKTVFVGWPHLHEARVIAVANESFKIELLVESGKSTAAVSFNRKKLSDMESAAIAREATTIKDRHMDRFAINVGKTEIIVYASLMTGRTYTYGHSGNITLDKQFASLPTPFAHQMTTKELLVKESGHTTFKTLEEVFPKDSTIFMLGTPHYGAEGKVLEVLSDSARVRIALDVTVEPDLQQLGHMHMNDSYMTAYQGAHLIGVDTHILSRITGSVFVERSGQNQGKANVGLNLKFTKREEEVPGYTRKEENGWTYSRNCVELVSQFINRFPDLWQRISAARSTSDVHTEADLFPEGSSSTMADVLKYLEDLPSSKAPRMKFGAEILDHEQVARIENVTENVTKKPVTVKMKIKPRLLFRPLTSLGSIVPDPQTDFLLYDRIIVVKPGYSVPFGKRGTIIGIPMEEGGILSPHSIYDVVFDEPFAGGITLRCSQNKGYRVPGSSMLNITYGEFRKNRPLSERPTAGVWNRGRKGNNPHSAGYSKDIRGNRKTESVLGGKQQAVAWDSKRQPLFGQIFAGQDNASSRNQGMIQPKFVTPKVQGPQQVLASKPNMKTDSVDFNSVWKNLQNQKTKSEEPSRVDVGSASLMEEPMKILSKTEPPGKVMASPQSNIIPLVQSLFANPTKTGSQPVEENSEFLAMFNSLKSQTEEFNKNGSKHLKTVDKEDNGLSSKEASAEALTVTDLEADGNSKVEAKSKCADNALKQMLKIGTASDSVSPSISPSSFTAGIPSSPGLNTSASYGRQVSLQELFDEANRQMKTQQKGDATKTTDGKTVDNKDPVKELESYCAVNGLVPPSYDFKHQSKQMAYIANVLVHSRGRYEGSMCPNKTEAAKSAASIALLCLTNKPNPPKVMPPFVPGAPRPGIIHPLFSHNSAFSPIGMTGQLARVQSQQPDLMRPPPLLTPRHFTSQPPPTAMPTHQPPSLLSMPRQPPPHLNLHPQQHPDLIMKQLHQQLQKMAIDYGRQMQQQQQPPQHLQFNILNQDFNKNVGNRPPHPSQQPFQSSANQKLQFEKMPEKTAQGPSSTHSSVSQPFIPLQVSRNQKTLKSKKDDKSNSTEESTNVTKSPSMDEVVRKLDVMCDVEPFNNGGDNKINAAAGRQKDDVLLEKDFGFSTQPFSPNGLQEDAVTATDTKLLSTAMATSPSFMTTDSNDMQEKRSLPKKKSRLAANFTKKSSGPDLSKTK